ncbi:putative protein farnesyltransferase alpha subunit [Leishmania braziliensis MHOM/BR/75/M2904]|uniref:Protein farnesyltransferase/geranylgeranyltransferase type-1 subunit alpha n=1 Tax=Leishmania braziliensis TaxID=5660 RepID=A4HHJ5_LEIBR|nr:putative protein farnesyltransferase alpha subunit [Leishmania braziliensis MHOM/BR/75/M2904]CAJ2476666.1 unnamed protein product [Leishmania braziliensis]CAM40048.2 putative protein farnesyltransferase alpha subunit [Leishmania braziliensis MHOM/BR/75/M2904]
MRLQMPPLPDEHLTYKECSVLACQPASLLTPPPLSLLCTFSPTPISLYLLPAIHHCVRLRVDIAGAMSRSNRSSSSSSSSLSSWVSASSACSQSSKDGEWLYQLACVEAFVPLVADVTPADESSHALPEHPVAKIHYSPNFSFIYGVYRSLRDQLDYTPILPAHGEQCGSGELPPVIHAIHTSAARWFLLLAFALRQCTSNYTVWKDRRDVLMSPAVLEQATRDALPAFPVPEAILSCTASEAEKQEALRKLDEQQKKLRLTSQHWLPARADVLWEGRPSPWRAVHWELAAVGCFTRLYHKNFQVWHHRRELLTYALQQTPSYVRCSADAAAAAAADGKPEQQAEDSSPLVPALASEATLSDYLRRHAGLDFSAIDERPTLRAVLCNEDGKNYHAWLHLSWYLQAFSFLLTPPSREALEEHAIKLTGAVDDQESYFTPHPGWITASESAAPAALSPTLPPSPLTEELQFTAQLIYQDCRNNSVWCHRFVLLREALFRRLWRQLCSDRYTSTVGTLPTNTNWQRTARIVCAVEMNYSLQWLYVDPTNEAAYTHTRSVALLFHILTTRQHVWAAEHARADGSEELQRYLADAPLLTPVALTNSELSANADAGTVCPSTELLHLLRDRQRCVPWDTYVESFGLLRYMQRVLHTVISARVTELEEQAARILRLAVASDAITSPGQEPKPQAIAALAPLYERSSQYMLDSFHQVDSAQYLACQAILEEMWLTYMDAAQRRRVRQLRPSEAYREGLLSEWLRPCPWGGPEKSAADVDKLKDRQDAVVLNFLAYEAAALSKAKQLTMADPIRLKYWKREALNIMCRVYGTAA